MGTPVASAPQSYLVEIGSIFYSYRLAEFNRRYYEVLLDRAKRKALAMQVAIGVLTAVAVVLFTIPTSMPGDAAQKAMMDRLNPIAAALAALAFVANAVAPLFEWNRTIDEITARIHAYQYAASILESALRFLHHHAKTKGEANLQTQVANQAFGIANSYPGIGKQDMKLSQAIYLEVAKAYPPNYVWTAL